MNGNTIEKVALTKKPIEGSFKFPISDKSGTKVTASFDQMKEYLEAPKDGKAYFRKDGDWESLELSGYEDLLSYGVEWDITESDPNITRIGNPLLHKSLPVQSSYKGCIADGKTIKYYLNPNDWTKKADGTESKLDGTDGQVKVHITKFYGKSGINGNKRWVRISLFPIDKTWTEIPEMLVSAYRVTVNNSKTYSVMNTSPEFRGGGNRSSYDTYLSTNPSRSDLGKPRTAQTRATMRTYARNNGEELLCYDYYKWIFYWNYVIEYASFNSQDTFNPELTVDGYHQGGLGAGVTTWSYSAWTDFNGNYPTVPCGYCNEFGNFTGVKDMTSLLADGSSKTVSVPRWRGFDNPFGDIYTILEGFVALRTVANEDSKIYATSDPANFDDSTSNKRVAGIEIAKDGYIKEFDLGETGEIIPSEVGAGATTYKCDYHYCNVEYTSPRGLLVGSNANSGGTAGLGDFYSHHSVGYAGAYAGFLTTVIIK